MGNSKTKDGGPVQINIRCDEHISQGVYSNFAKIAHTEDEFTIDFIYINPDPPFGKLQSRIITSPGHAKRFLMALQENITKYENNFGEIKVPTKPPGDIGYLQ
ncbi:MAG: hypothetical protein A3C43_08650 [Candidatus Schekmanbacteria bacterium RIFCSPHIGHO2_02_FULL_38_11]|uniref:DUF3467 domain-containing protein n=1 Tax=Candidatus Schekmanbacteria bacterium RIFCSPLOWO2_12_FULL_38_15 TaxID=1817883 RepID=A0A1F7SFR6_9BACT|nr:MAG: hypothetical protein A2043_11340 [Candidatus Schekmanbacteria bacterium GWA2_38_9]OGL49421.1 MAG: hypothetical protein A3H37_07020 [Candidatus Schekmanbacteria bacterium RIFCSPLOWO2_02_FULL_38_14]OGL52646.1 MAG: hypothetical protein A3G31_11845 [Candidatus Schekmanbacteria bacterium RIFCSPLOWO2_12_FULL_38_15]OGL54450.1 MAG: hypothetical protein A3C43_08650 [Candidatus Schekmanbacteria bacterium RIFCSPHIGHO2_02_FULL_38_11]